MATIDAISYTEYPDPEQGVSALYFTLWPEIIKVAMTVIKKCLVWKYAFKTGYEFHDVEMCGRKWVCRVYVMPAPAHLP